MVEPSNIQPDTGLINPQEIAGNFGSATGNGLTPKQQLKQDAALWAEFLYSEYKLEKALREGAQTMPTHYDNSDA